MRAQKPLAADPRERILFFFSISLALLLFLPPTNAHAGQFTVSPIRLNFDQKNRSGVVHVLNEEKEVLQVQMKAYVWTQDAEGKDQYAETDDLLFFPKLATINPNQERIIRVGIKQPSKNKEETYRLFVEEIPRKDKVQEQTQIRVAIRLGVPIFVSPAHHQVLGHVAQMTLMDGKLHLAVQNQGNTHFIIESILIRGTNPSGEAHFSKELSGWYLLTGSKRAYATDIPREICLSTSVFDVEVKTSEFVLNEKLNVDQNLCAP